MVSRYRNEAETEASVCSNGNIWDGLSQQQSSCWMEEYQEAPPLMTSGCVVQRLAEAERDPFPWQIISTTQKLPPPKELCRKKRKGPKRKRLENVRALSVCSHLEELRRWQSSMDELKKAKWGGLVPQPFSEGAGGTTDSLTKIICHDEDGDDDEGSLSPFSMLKPAFHLYEEHPVFSERSKVQLLYPEWNPTMRQQLGIPQESSVVSYTMATQDRCQASTGCLYRGFKLQSEE